MDELMKVDRSFGFKELVELKLEGKVSTTDLLSKARTFYKLNIC